jgi:redox-sensitive bicupin YhaK (pirin superfamily)
MIDLIIEARKASIAEGMSVKRILPFRMRRMVGPFIFMDHAGPVNMPASSSQSMDVLPHPHIGLSTVTYLLDGRVTHRDSLGVKQEIRPGEVNWMTAGRGISHSERFEDPSILVNGIEMLQTWVALPEQAEEANPTFENYQPEQLPLVTDKGVWMRLIAGDAYGVRSDVRTHSPLFYVHAVLAKGSTFDLPHGHTERAIYIVKGSLEVAGRSYSEGQMIVFNPTAEPKIISTSSTVIMMLGGEPLGERFIWWNFVSSRKERIDQAKEDWKQGRIELPPGDTHEFVPLPEDKFKVSGDPPPQALS